MQRIAMLLAAAAILGVAGWAQNTSTGGTSAPANVTGKQAGTHHHQGEESAGGAKGGTLTGCLNGPNAENAYILTNRQHKRGVEVGMRASDELSKHVGHKVRLSGSWVGSGAEIGEKEQGGEGEERERGERHFQVTKIEHLAESCTMGGSGQGGSAASAPGNEKNGAITSANTDDKVTKKGQEQQKKEERQQQPAAEVPKGR